MSGALWEAFKLFVGDHVQKKQTSSWLVVTKHLGMLEEIFLNIDHLHMTSPLQLPSPTSTQSAKKELNEVAACVNQTSHY